MYNYKAIVKRIIDGDSLILDIDLGFNMWMKNKSTRLYGVDTPEIRTRNAVEKKAGLLAKEFVEGKLTVGDSITIDSYLDKSEKFGRILVVVKTENGDNINDLLLKENLAIKYYGQSSDDLKKYHEENFKILLERKLI
jgi:micrococcal nuclease